MRLTHDGFSLREERSMSRYSQCLKGGVLICALAATLAFPAGAAVTLYPTFIDQARVGGIDRPTSFAFLPDGRLLITEQWTGNLRLVVAGSILSGTPVFTQPDLITNYEQGLLSLAVDPGWPARPYIYMHYTSTAGCMRLVRYTGVGDIADPSGTALSFTDPYVVLDSLQDTVPWHNGGALHFGLDGKLYFSIGDDGQACRAQDVTSLLGCIVRLDVSGLPAGAGGPPPRRTLAPYDNPWAANPDSNAALVWAMGFRNPFRFQFDSGTGQMYVSDVGQDLWEEIDAPVSGSNAGWPYREAMLPIDYPYCPEPGGMGSQSLLDPIDWYTHGEGSVIIAAGVFRHSTMNTSWPANLDGSVFYADWIKGTMRMIRNEPENGWVRLQGIGSPGPSPTYWATGLSFPVDFTWGPDGNLWWLSYQDESEQPGTGGIHRISFNPYALDAGSPLAESVDLSAVPNPWRTHTDLSFQLPRGSRVRLELFDLSGRRLATLIDGERPAGFQHARWSGTTSSAGLVFARLTWDGGSSTTRLIRMR